MGINSEVARGLRRVSPVALLRQARRPSQLKIGTRLTLCFVMIVMLMVISHGFTLWQFDRVRTQEERMHDLDQESHAVLSLHANLLTLRDQLEEVIAKESADGFTVEAVALRSHFMQEIERASDALGRSRPRTERDPTVLSTLETIQSSLPEQIDTLTDLAKAKDWPAMRLRVQNQVGPLSSLTSLLVEKVDSEVSEEKAHAQQHIQRLERRVFAMHILAAFLALLVAGMLGTMVTRSITQPLSQLDAGAHALALGDFRHRVAVEGNDELANLGGAFNDASQRLSELYEALKVSEERFRRVVATAPVGIAVLDENATIQMCNARFLEIVGLTPEQANGMRLNDPSLAVFREDGTHCPLAERPSQRAIATGKPVLNVVLRNFHPISGERRWVLTSAWPLLRENGSVYQVIATLTDITEQKSVEEELRSGRELLAQAQRAAHLGGFELDLRSEEVVWSAELTDLFGLPPGNLSGRHQDWEALVHPDDLARASAGIAEALKTGESVAEYRIRRHNDSEIRWVESRGRVFCDETGQPFRMIGVTMDITERKEAEEALRRSEEDFHIIFEHAAIGMVLVDPSGLMLRSNPAFRAMLGYDKSELPVMSFVDVTHPDDVALSKSLYQDVIDGKLDRYRVKKRYIRKDGGIRSARLTVSALRRESGELRYCVSMVEDITSQELAEHSLLQMSDRLLRIQEEEQRRIAREVHDSTSQEMTALTLNLGALKAEQRTLPENARKQIAESLALAKRVARELRTFSYLLHPPMLNELGLWGALPIFVEEFRERSGLRATLEIPKTVERTRLHSRQEMALFRFVQEGLANVHRHSGSTTAAVRVQLKNRSIEASVTDTGRGFAPELLKEISSSSGLAAGVGISGMHERIGYIGGRVEIQSDERGTTVTAIVPLEYQGTEQAMERSSPRSEPFHLPLENPRPE